jgi:hypothetical protein
MAKQNKTQWILKSLKQYGLEKTKKRFNQFKKSFPDATLTSYNVSVKREYNIYGEYNNIDKALTLVDEKEKKKQLKIKEATKKNIIAKYSMLASRNKTVPSYAELTKDYGITTAEISSVFKDKSELEEEARSRFPKRFNGVIDKSKWNKTRIKSLQSEINKYKRFVITTYIVGADIHTGFWDSIKSYCKKQKAMLLIIVADNQISDLPEWMENENVVYDDVKINNNLYVSSIKILPKMIEPTTGLNRIGGKTGSFIFGSPKQRLVFIPTHTSEMVPHCIMTTGAVTFGAYQGRKYYQQRTDYLAKQDHKIGAIVVEKEDQTVFHFRQLQADPSGAFIDLGKRYNPEGKVESLPAEAIVYGDWHSGDTDPQVALTMKKLSKEVGAKKAIIHDGFNGESVNHHEKNNSINKAIRSESRRDCLKEELDGYTEDLNGLSEIYDEITIVWSNHDEFIMKYLNSGDYVHDSRNHLISLHLAVQAVQEKNPIEWYVSQKLNKPSKIKWLGVDDDVRICGIKISDHGHLGANGSRGTLAGLEKTTSKAVYAHSHTPQILRESWQVGTSTYLRLPYTKGPGSWVNTCCLIYPGGYRQLINCINGKYKI